MRLRKILGIIAVCTILTSCGSDKEVSSLNEVTQEIITENVKEDVKVVKFSAKGELTKEMVTEQLDKSKIDPNDDFSAVIEDGVTRIGMSAFSHRSNLVSVTMSDSVTEIDGNVFLNCYNLQTVVLPEGIELIDGSAFSGCERLEKINLPDSITKIWMDAFKGCNNLVIDRFYCNADIPYQAFQGVTIKELIISKDLELFRCRVFNDANVEKIIFEEGIKELKLEGKVAPKTVTEIVLPDGLQEVCNFSSYVKLKKINIPDSVTKIEYYTFEGCTELETLTIPASVTFIGEDAFLGCDKLVLTVNSGTLAEDYAIENEIPYQIVGQEGKIVEPMVNDVKIEYSKLPEESEECVAIKPYLVSRSHIWDVYDVVITGTEEITTVSFEVPDYMKDYEGDSYIIYAFEGTDFKKVSCELKDNIVSFQAEKSGVYALVQYDSNVWFYDEFVEHSDMIVEEERYIEKVMYTTQETEVLDIYIYGNVIGTLPKNERVEINSSVMEWVCIYYEDTFGWLPLTSLSDTSQ